MPKRCTDSSDYSSRDMFSLVIRLRVLVTVCAVFVLSGAKLFAQFDPLDDTAAFIHLVPNPVTGYTCEEVDVNVHMVATDARVFDLQFVFDSDNFMVAGVTPGTHADLNVMPYLVEADTITIDGFFHPNFTGSTVIATMHFMALNELGDQSTLVGFLVGQGFSGDSDNPEAMLISGDSTTINLEGTPPLAPESLIINNMMDDSVLLRWRPVDLDVDSDPVFNPWYMVEFEDVLNNEGTYSSIGSTQDTFFYHDFIIYDFDPGDTGTVNVGTYRIKALKCEP